MSTDSQPGATPPVPEASEPGKPYTAVVYVHGMGEQRRYEELSRLIDGLDVYANALVRKTPGPRGTDERRWLRDIGARIEPCRIPGNGLEDVGFVRMDCDPPDRVHEVGSLYRFYEVYWAPATAGGTSAKSVIAWLARQVATPLRTIRSSWRERQRLRRAALHQMWRQPWLARVCRVQDGDLGKLVDAYNRFEGPEARRSFPAGTFGQFRRFVAQRSEKRPDSAVRLDHLARAWGVFYLATELFHLFVLVALVLTMAALAGFAVYGAWRLYDFVWNRSLMETLRQAGLGALESFAPSGPNTLAALGLFVTALGLTRFVTTFLGDVQLWCTYEETDEKNAKRTAILARATERLEHVLRDTRCARLIVVAHSLGTAIATDALLRLGRHNRARNPQNPIAGPVPLEKITAFVTMGSPVDKIHYFFESYRSDYHRYIRVTEGIRGDITTVPFAKNRKPHVHWINFWDQGDVISSALETPAGARLTDLTVDNVYVSNYWFPSPGASHSAYFTNRDVLAALYNIIFKGTADFAHAPRENPADARSPYDYDALRLGPGAPRRMPRVFQLLALALPWLLFASLLAGPASRPWSVVAGTAVGVLVAAWIWGKVRGQLAPLT